MGVGILKIKHKSITVGNLKGKKNLGLNANVPTSQNADWDDCDRQSKKRILFFFSD